jgi:hypothetical protein
MTPRRVVAVFFAGCDRLVESAAREAIRQRYGDAVQVTAKLTPVP